MNAKAIDPMEWSNLEEAASYLEKTCGGKWNPRLVVSACVRLSGGPRAWGEDKELHPRRPLRLPALKGAAPLGTSFSLFKWEDGKGLVRQCATRAHLLPLYMAHLGELLTSGITETQLVSQPVEGNGAEGEYIMADMPVRIDLASAGISRASMLELVACIKDAAAAFSLTDVAAEGEAIKPETAKERNIRVSAAILDNTMTKDDARKIGYSDANIKRILTAERKRRNASKSSGTNSSTWINSTSTSVAKPSPKKRT